MAFADTANFHLPGKKKIQRIQFGVSCFQQDKSTARFRTQFGCLQCRQGKSTLQSMEHGSLNLSPQITRTDRHCISMCFLLIQQGNRSQVNMTCMPADSWNFGIFQLGNWMQLDSQILQRTCQHLHTCTQSWKPPKRSGPARMKYKLQLTSLSVLQAALLQLYALELPLAGWCFPAPHPEHTCERA